MPTKTTRKPKDAKQPLSEAEIAKTGELGDNDLDAAVGGFGQLANAAPLSRAGSSSSGSESSGSS